MINKLRFKPSILFSGRRRSVSQVSAIQSKICCNASIFRISDKNAVAGNVSLLDGIGNRGYAVFNFVDDSSSDETHERIITHGGPKKSQFETSSGQQSPALARHEVQLIRDLQCSETNNSEKEDDEDFAELGLPVHNIQKPSENGKQPKNLLANEIEKAGRLAFVKQLPVKVKSNTKIPLKQNIQHPGFHLNLEDDDGVSSTKTESEMQKHVGYTIPDHTSSNCLIVEKVPLSITVSQLKEAMSVYGEVSNAFLDHGHNGFRNCQIEFKTVESLERALVARRVTVENFHLEIRSLQAQKTFVIRISNISMNTAESTIHSICMSCGSMERLQRTKKDYLDVVFRDKDHLSRETVLKQLNDVRVDDCHWSAKLLLKDAANQTVNASDAKREVGSKIRVLTSVFREQLQMKMIYLQDLESLHHAILHIEEYTSDQC